MRKLTKILTPAVAAMGIVAMVPAPAMAAAHNAQAPQQQRYDNNDRHQDSRQSDRKQSDYKQSGASSSIRSEIAQLSNNIDRAQKRGTISRREASSLKSDAVQLKRLYASYAKNGLNRSETATLNKRIDRIQYALRAERRDNNNRRG